jgi:hypothetical protein
MRPPKSRTSAVLVCALTVTAAASAAPGLAAWASSISTGPQALSSVALAAPPSVAAARGACTVLNATSLTVTVTWTATPTQQAQGYAILRSTSAGGPFTMVSTTTGINATSWTDATKQLAFSTTYYYIVKSTVGTWTSPAAGPASITTPNTLCI